MNDQAMTYEKILWPSSREEHPIIISEHHYRERLMFVVLGPPVAHTNPITVAQLQALQETRSDIELSVGDSGTRNSRDTIAIDPTGYAPGTLTLIDGRLQTNNPDAKTVEWMLKLASALDGRVIDSTLRTYRSPQESYIHPDDRATRKSIARNVRLARKKWVPNSQTIIKWAIVGMFALLGVILFTVFR